MNEAQRPVLLCYDGSDGARAAISAAGSLLGPRRAIVLHVWQGVGPTGAAPPGLPAAGPQISPELIVQLTDAARTAAEQTAEEGAEVARQAGFDADALAWEAEGWRGVVEAAEENDVSVVVAGSRGRSGIRAAVLGSFSNALVHHCDRPLIVVPQRQED